MSLISKVLGTISGGNEEKLVAQLLFNKTLGIRGIIDGVGASTLVQNLAMAIADRTDYTVCVIDTNIMYPAQQYLLGLNPNATKDIMDYTGKNISDIANRTKYKNVYLASYIERGTADILSSKECQATIVDLLEDAKKYFDVVLIDISHELTWVSCTCALSCNKIYTVLEPSLTCVSVLQKSINSEAQLAVSFHKMRKCIINKNIASVNSGLLDTLKEYKLDVIATIPLSDDIAAMGIAGERIYGSFSNKPAITAFNVAIEVLLDDILESNEINQDKMLGEGQTNGVQEVQFTAEQPAPVNNMTFSQPQANANTNNMAYAQQQPANNVAYAQQQSTPAPQPVNNMAFSQPQVKSGSPMKRGLFNKRPKVAEAPPEPTVPTPQAFVPVTNMRPEQLANFDNTSSDFDDDEEITLFD